MYIHYTLASWPLNSQVTYAVEPADLRDLHPDRLHADRTHQIRDEKKPIPRGYGFLACITQLFIINVMTNILTLNQVDYVLRKIASVITDTFKGTQ